MAQTEEKLVYERPHSLARFVTNYCPGCTHGIVNRLVAEVIDELDPIPDSFMLEISSPGMARPLRKRRDFERFAGQTVQLTTKATEGRRKFTGELLGLEGDTVRLSCDGETFEIAFDEVKTCKIKPNYDA